LSRSERQEYAPDELSLQIAGADLRGGYGRYIPLKKKNIKKRKSIGKKEERKKKREKEKGKKEFFIIILEISQYPPPQKNKKIKDLLNSRLNRNSPFPRLTRVEGQK
jgi:hypothetical protein